LLASLGHLARRDAAAAPPARWVAMSPGQVVLFAELGIPWLTPKDSERAGDPGSGG